jgi:hypothetical protein
MRVGQHVPLTARAASICPPPDTCLARGSEVQPVRWQLRADLDGNAN